MLRLAAQSWVDGFPNLRFFRYAIVPLVVSLRGKPNDAKVTFFMSLILFFTGLPKPDSQNARAPPLDEKRHFWTRDKGQKVYRSFKDKELVAVALITERIGLVRPSNILSECVCRSRTWAYLGVPFRSLPTKTTLCRFASS